MTTFDQTLTATVATARRHTLGDLLRRSARRVPDKTAIVYRDLRQTYAELNETVNRTANALAQRGVAKGDRIALLSHNNHAYVVTCFALARLGAVTVPVNFMLGAAEVAYILQHSGATGMIVEDTLHTVAQEAIETANPPGPLKVRGILGDGRDLPAGWEPFAAWTGHDDATEPDVAIDEDDVLQLMYTSGTESRPKGAMMTSRSLVAQYTSCIVDGRYQQSDIEIHALPLFHVAAQHCFLVPGLHVGATNVILDGPDPATLLETVERERVTKLFCPPTVWISLLRHPDFDTRDLSSLRKGYYGASIMPVEVIKELQQRLPGMDLFNYYGQTEMSAVALILQPEDQVRKAGSAGRPALNVETMLVDSDDNPVPPGVEGEIVHRSPHATLGYWADPEKTAEAYRGGWFHSGDLGVMDAEGYITVVDRKKDMIKTGGENVASREVEETIYQHAAVAEVAVFGVQHPKWIEAVVAAVVPREGQSVDTDELAAFCRQQLAGYKTPKYFVVVDQLPKNASGKILKRDLRTAFAHLVG
ncbi:acyl-CoA synthetase [Pseudonocardia hispaniensis]|uniref:Acyl-CoA synthetase n=1 Tax=Pseudonocardia hispaniensis TaxID=904933 RepID=A0ABW1J6Q5_9PSEU